MGSAIANVKLEPACEFANGKVVGLLELRYLRGSVRHPNATNLNVAGKRKGRDSHRLNAALRMLSRVAIEQGEARAERRFAHAKTDNAVGKISEKLFANCAYDGVRADRLFHVESGKSRQLPERTSEGLVPKPKS